MDIGIKGTLGQGKTTALVAFAEHFRCKTGLPVFSNMKRYVNTILIDSKEKLLKADNCIIAYDELWKDLNSHAWKFTAADIEEWIMSTRKKSIILIYTAQNLGMVNNRLRDVTDIMIFCTRKRKDEYEWDIYDWQTKTLKRKWHCNNPQPYYNLFDTLEMPGTFLKNVPQGGFKIQKKHTL